MLYNSNLKTAQNNCQCMECRFFNKLKKKCEGLGKICFEFDEKTNTLIDPITKLPTKI